MLLRMETLALLDEVGEDKFKARPGLTEAQKAKLRRIDEGYYKIEKEHLIINYEDLR